ncbi:hypothetical protein CY34DRAFT_402953 [Suillus luteus UH-Slu-Lm8-n1]|uniref:Uncharacterized protein n=1 Tax=Suillus luteus UH-Slu-Lm8-n1 TaxID=930992 RepID=A0A0D0AJE4_9AGAM|nr:hypothetical protein CY34DRAFT_402953 [Suillus luteus UH-Slu-Lm8-n1]
MHQLGVTLHRSFNQGMAVPQEKDGNVVRRDNTTVYTCHGLPLCKKNLAGCLIEPAQQFSHSIQNLIYDIYLGKVNFVE